MEKRKIHKERVTTAVIAGLTLCIMALAFLFGGVTTARALNLPSSTGTFTCTLKASGTGELTQITGSYSRTESTVDLPTGGTEKHFTWTLTFDSEVSGKNNLRCENTDYKKKADGSFYITTETMIQPNFSSLVFLYDTTPLELPEEPTKQGYHFVGWYLDEELTVPYKGEPITADMQFYAKFEINTYTVTLDVKGGSAVNNLIVEWNTAAELPTPERVGYIFVGWFYESGTKYEGQAVTEDITLQARWEIRYYTVTFYVDGAIYKTLEVKHGMTFQAAMTADLRYYNLLNDSGEVISKSATVTEDMDVSIEAMTQEEKQAAFFAQNMWLVWGLVAVAGAGILSTAIAALVAHKRK